MLLFLDWWTCGVTCYCR